MENPNHPYRLAMRKLQKALPKYSPPLVCIACAGWKSFGGSGWRDVSMGPICICDAHWRRLEIIVQKMRKQPVLS